MDEPTTWEGSILRARTNPKIGHAPFYFYYFASRSGRRNIETIVEQVAAPGVRGSDLGRLQVPVPPLTEQRAIAEGRGALDDKIAANTKLAQLTEWVRTNFEQLSRSADETDLSAVEISWPGDAIAHRFGVAVDAMRAAVQAALAENRTLAATRDALLPQLMSGKLRVKDAEKVAAEVV